MWNITISILFWWTIQAIYKHFSCSLVSLAKYEMGSILLSFKYIMEYDMNGN